MSLRLFNSLTRSKEEFCPLDADNVRLYVCGPTVYDYAHIGNARPAIVFDVLYRLLRHVYGKDHVKYVRNITDVDDKINARALQEYPDLALNEAVAQVTERTTAQYHADIAALGCLTPDVEPTCTSHIPDMVEMIEALIAKDCAYVAEGHVLFEVAKAKDYGTLSKRSLDEMLAGARVEVAPYKKNPMDFVLWKPSDEETPGWPSPWGRGRPGWHIECSAMAARHLGQVFDIHGGGIDLQFPHHENELAQTRCAFGSDKMANVWMHNGFLQVEGEKMSKSLGNFITIHDLLGVRKFGDRSWHGEVLRLAMLKTHYRQPIDWTVHGLEDSFKELRSWANALENSLGMHHSLHRRALHQVPIPTQGITAALNDDLNTPEALSELRAMYSRLRAGNETESINLLESCEFLGLLRSDHLHVFNQFHVRTGRQIIPTELSPCLDEIQVAIANGNLDRQAVLTRNLGDQGVIVSSRADGFVSYEVVQALRESISETDIDTLIAARSAARAAKNWAEADRIRDELAGMGIQLMDSKDPATGEIVTTWEVKR